MDTALRGSIDQRGEVMSHGFATYKFAAVYLREEGLLSPSLSIRSFPRHWLVSTEPCLVGVAMILTPPL